MKLVTASIAATMLACACSTVPAASSQRLAEYRSHAGGSVSSFRYLGRLDNWDALGDAALAIWTSPREAWLLELSGPCNGLEDATFVALTSRGGQVGQIGQVEAGFDKVLVRDPSSTEFPCRIRTIRPLDVAAIRQLDQQNRQSGESSPDRPH